MEEVNIVIEDLKKKLSKSSGEGELAAVNTYFDSPDLNIIWELVAGIR